MARRKPESTVTFDMRMEGKRNRSPESKDEGFKVRNMAHAIMMRLVLVFRSGTSGKSIRAICKILTATRTITE